MSVKGFDTVLKGIEENLSASRSSNFVLAIIGTNSNLIQDSGVVSFIETESRTLAAASLK